MKKNTKFSIALVGSTLLSSSSSVGATPPGDNPFTLKPQNVANDSFLGKLGWPADLVVAQANLKATQVSHLRADGSGSPATGSTTTPTTEPTSESTTTPGSSASGTPATGTTETPPVVTNPDNTQPPSSSASGTTTPGDTPATTATGTPVVMSNINFNGLQEHYKVGETVNVSVNLTPEAAGATGKVDLWVAITIPNVPDFIFFTGTANAPQFSVEPHPFLQNLEVTANEPAVLVFPIPPGIGGGYTFYALLVEAGKNPLEGVQYNRSNLTMGTTTLDNQ